jgi:hypothetical protein
MTRSLTSSSTLREANFNSSAKFDEEEESEGVNYVHPDDEEEWMWHALRRSHCSEAERHNKREKEAAADKEGDSLLMHV